MTRIIGGHARGRRLRVPARGTRPTSDRVREAMFATIEAKLRGDGRAWADVALCDLWAGSGAVALEGWSRGAQRVVAIEKSASATSVIEANAKDVGADEVVVIRSSVATAATSPPPGGPFTVMFADPPYDDPDSSVAKSLETVIASGWFESDAIIVVERGIRSESPFPAGVSEVEQRPYGDTALWYGRVSDEREDEQL